MEKYVKEDLTEERKRYRLELAREIVDYDGLARGLGLSEVKD